MRLNLKIGDPPKIINVYMACIHICSQFCLQVWFLSLHASNRIRTWARNFLHCIILPQLCYHQCYTKNWELRSFTSASVWLVHLVLWEQSHIQDHTGVQWLRPAAELAHLGSSLQELMKSIFGNDIVSWTLSGYSQFSPVTFSGAGKQLVPLVQEFSWQRGEFSRWQ